jgi:Protein of unknown function (DUF3829)
MRHLRLIVVLIISIGFLFGCSKVTKLFDEAKKETKTSKGGSDDGGNEPAGNDVEFYNKYIDVLNTISPTVDNYQKTYYQSVPEPSKLSKSSFVTISFTSIYITQIEDNLKKYKRSYFDGGELSKLSTSNEAMKDEIETAFKNFIKSIESYKETAAKVNDYYKDNNFKDELSKAKMLDDEIRNKYDEYSKSFDAFRDVLKKYKPKRVVKNPDDISNPDEKAVAILQNMLEATIDQAEPLYESFAGIDANSDLTKFKSLTEEFKKNLTAGKEKVFAAPFSDKSKYLKHSFEDYFLKMATDFQTACEDFIKKSDGGKLKGNSYNNEYDNVKNRYNYMVQAYNSTIGMTNSFRVY